MNNRSYKKRTNILILILSLAMLISSVPVFAVNGGSASGVTTEMGKASYWYSKTVLKSNRVLMTNSEIDKRNQDIVDTSGVSTYDMSNFSTVYSRTYNADKKRIALAKNTPSTNDLYIDGVLIDKDAYYSTINQAILDTGYTDTERENTYAVCTTYANVKSIPTEDIIGYYATDPDDEIQSSALLVNEPFLIRGKCDYNGETYYWGFADNITGWVNSKNLAICASEEEWHDAWDVKNTEKDFLVVTQDKIILEPSLSAPYSSKLNLTIGTILKLVPDSKIPTNIGERGTWNNYVVYIPTRTEDGKYKKEITLIAQHYTVSEGFLPFTQENVLDLAFSCLGNRYGWGSMLESMDCSAYVRNIYRCFGLRLPRNTSWQKVIPDTAISLSGLTDTEKYACLAGLPSGTPLYFSGHTMIYTGSENLLNYVISDTGTVSDSQGTLNATKKYSVILTPLNVRRKSGATWLADLSEAVVWPYLSRISDCTITAEKLESAEDSTARIIVTDSNGKILKKDKDYTILYPESGIVSVIGRGNYVGVQRKTIEVVEPYLHGDSSAVNDKDADISEETVSFLDVNDGDYFYDAVSWAVKNDITQGISDTLFKPDNKCTRGHIVTFLWRINGCPEPNTSNNPFSDVSLDSYYGKAVLWAYQNGITTGTTKTTFEPDKDLNRAQAIVLIHRASEDGIIDGSCNYKDVPSGAYYRNAVIWASENDITKGISANKFGPGVICTRGQIVTFLFRAKDYF